MSKRYSKVLAEHTSSSDYRCIQILESEGVFAVFYDGKPINIKIFNKIKDRGPKYSKFAFPNPGHAFALAERLNKTFKTDKFEVYKLDSGKKVIKPKRKNYLVVDEE